MSAVSGQATLERIEAYLDAAPRSAADADPVGKFTLFRARGPWPYYARPKLGLDEPIALADVDELRRRQRELRLPENIEWVYETTPSLADAAADCGLNVARYPLLVLDLSAFAVPDPPPGVELRLLDADDPDFALAHAVASVGFSVPGTAVGVEGSSERDARLRSESDAITEFMRERTRTGLGISVVAIEAAGPVAVGTHQPVGDTTEIVGVATLPAARRRGLGAAVTARLVADALGRGIGIVFLSAGSEDVARVYERIGFRRIGSAGSAEPAG